MIRKANIQDAPAIQQLIISNAKRGLMLNRSLNSVYDYLRDFWVYTDKDNKILGCAALHIIGWDALAEVKSLSVSDDAQNKGIGKSLVNECITEAKTFGITKVFALTYVPDFFNKCGFDRIDMNTLPHKIWSDCIDCPSYGNCNEIAVMRSI